MSDQTKIEWADYTFNPWIGCTKVSPACDNCYAETWDKRFKGQRWGAKAPRTRTSVANWRKPLKWNRQAEKEGKRYRVFCASLADVFDNHRSITSGWHGDLWALIEQTPNLDWLLLTKRPQNIKKMLPETYGMSAWGNGWDNVWLGTTAENQIEAERRIPHLLDVPARIHFLSCEPLLEEFGLSRWLYEKLDVAAAGLTDDPLAAFLLAQAINEGKATGPTRPKIDWVIAGGESGTGARPMHIDWARGLRDQCATSGTPFFFKQYAGESRQAIQAKGRLLDGVSHNEVPA